MRTTYYHSWALDGMPTIQILTEHFTCYQVLIIAEHLGAAKRKALGSRKGSRHVFLRGRSINDRLFSVDNSSAVIINCFVKGHSLQLTAVYKPASD